MKFAYFSQNSGYSAVRFLYFLRHIVEKKNGIFTLFIFVHYICMYNYYRQLKQKKTRVVFKQTSDLFS